MQCYCRGKTRKTLRSNNWLPNFFLTTVVGDSVLSSLCAYWLFHRVHATSHRFRQMRINHLVFCCLCWGLNPSPPSLHSLYWLTTPIPWINIISGVGSVWGGGVWIKFVFRLWIFCFPLFQWEFMLELRTVSFSAIWLFKV